ncbi:hypothetical protein IE81DRAFT_324904 [Ceraceosorus guamensis]|uniref:Uncharacterized protein n=1 Tax=Ceraceosorus guamensis TaxID=1522189 RepID=A0A316VUZ2_9BASI|nr:hypothetical protein IE81DRAFT_324904 [Ceraceosorus guamensis]PWN41084.1 hypothetical protein IE81DRAFT_324904 [Ceraceosorus guamensis]
MRLRTFTLLAVALAATMAQAASTAEQGTDGTSVPNTSSEQSQVQGYAAQVHTERDLDAQADAFSNPLSEFLDLGKEFSTTRGAKHDTRKLARWFKLAHELRLDDPVKISGLTRFQRVMGTEDEGEYLNDLFINLPFLHARDENVEDADAVYWPKLDGRASLADLQVAKHKKHRSHHKHKTHKHKGNDGLLHQIIKDVNHDIGHIGIKVRDTDVADDADKKKHKKGGLVHAITKQVKHDAHLAADLNVRDENAVNDEDVADETDKKRKPKHKGKHGLLSSINKQVKHDAHLAANLNIRDEDVAEDQDAVDETDKKRKAKGNKGLLNTINKQVKHDAHLAGALNLRGEDVASDEGSVDEADKKRKPKGNKGLLNTINKQVKHDAHLAGALNLRDEDVADEADKKRKGKHGLVHDTEKEIKHDAHLAAGLNVRDEDLAEDEDKKRTRKHKHKGKGRHGLLHSINKELKHDAKIIGIKIRDEEETSAADKKPHANAVPNKDAKKTPTTSAEASKAPKAAASDVPEKEPEAKGKHGQEPKEKEPKVKAPKEKAPTSKGHKAKAAESTATESANESAPAKPSSSTKPVLPQNEKVHPRDDASDDVQGDADKPKKGKKGSGLNVSKIIKAFTRQVEENDDALERRKAVAEDPTSSADVDKPKESDAADKSEDDKPAATTGSQDFSPHRNDQFRRQPL